MKCFPWRQTGFRAAVLLTAALSLGPIPGAAVVREAPTTISFSVDGVPCPVESWEGGDPRGRTNADIDPIGAQRLNVGKQVTGVGVAPLTLEFSVPLPAPIQNWISAFFANQPALHQLGLVESTFSQTGGTGAVLNDCGLTEVRFSGLDTRTSRSARVTLVVQAVSWQRSATAGPAPARATHSVSSFRLQIAGLAADMIGNIEPFTVRRSPGGGVEFPNILVTMVASRAADWIAWRDASLGLGTAGAISPQKKNGSLQFLDSTQSPGLLALGLEGLQIIRATRIEEAGSEQGKVQAEMLCDRITVAAVGATAPAAASAPANQPPAEPAKPATPATATSGADQGERDPADFPRPEDMERQTFVASSSSTQQREYATYTAKPSYEKMVARYDQAVEKAGWKPAYRTASGETPASRMIIIEWHREGKEKETKESVAEVRIYSAKTGSTVAVTVTSYHSTAGK